ncbi:MAG TPA: RidA family protein [Burkholderiales bacterium]|nr:RidA family protein [Burkholderiales bacterium]
MNSRIRTEALLPVALGGGRIPYARGIRAGNWIFASGIMATDFEHGLAPDVAAAGSRLTGEPKGYREAACMYARAQEVLRAAGTDFSSVVRTDQFFPDWRAVPFLHQARREYCGTYIAPSTSILEPALLLPGAGMTMDLIAVDTQRGPAPKPLVPDGLDLPSTSAFVPVVTAGDFVFVAGFLAAWKPGDLGGIAPEAQVPAGHLWKGNRIQLEADYIIRNKLAPALKGAGSSLANVVKAQVYLADINDVPAFNQIWRKHFGERPPAVTFVPTLDPGFAIADARCEINLIALRDGGALIGEAIAPTGVTPTCDGSPVAVRAGDLLLFSGMVAADADGLVQSARIDPRQPHFSSSIEAQMDFLLDAAEKTCNAAGTSLANVVRIQQFHTNLDDFYPACKVWQQRLPAQPLPLSAVQVPAPLLVPGCTVQLDLWVYAP